MSKFLKLTRLAWPCPSYRQRSMSGLPYNDASSNNVLVFLLRGVTVYPQIISTLLDKRGLNFQVREKSVKL